MCVSALYTQLVQRTAIKARQCRGTVRRQELGKIVPRISLSKRLSATCIINQSNAPGRTCCKKSDDNVFAQISHLITLISIGTEENDAKWKMPDEKTLMATAQAYFNCILAQEHL